MALTTCRGPVTTWRRRLGTALTGYNRGMLSQETLDEYRRMTPGQRLELAFLMIRENTPYLLKGRPDVVRRRFELLERENNLRNAGIMGGLARLRGHQAR